jgi:hypothetical protein
MARFSEDREDLMRDAVALVERMEIQLGDQQIIIGFRQGGAGSIYIGQDPAYHFNSSNEFRRAIVSELLYKAEANRLVSLCRERDAAEVVLRRHVANAEDTTRFFDAFEAHRGAILRSLKDGTATTIAEIPAEGTLRHRTIGWLEKLLPPVKIAAHPRVT